MARRLARRVAKPWPKLQDSEGRYAGNVRGFTRYGEAVLGYGLIDVGVREGGKRMVASGLKAVTFAVEEAPYQKAESTFENLAVIRSYLVARRKLARDHRFRRVRPRWEAFLRRVRLSRLPNTSFYGNHWLVEAVYVLELLRTDLRSGDSQAILGGQRDRARELATDLINRRLVALMENESVRSGGESTLLLSDPPENPLPYQSLSFGMYARAVALLGPRASSQARELLRRTANASWQLTAPDGDLGYWGRNQEQAFAQAYTDYGAQLVADLPGSDRRQDRRYEALAQRALTRLRSAYVGGRYGLYIVPVLRRGVSASSLSGLDRSAGVPSFTGLALMALNWSLDDAKRRRPKRSTLRADRNSASVLGTGSSRFATVRRGKTWFAVKAAPGPGRIRDLRFDFGLAALKRRVGESRWVDVVPLKPYTDALPDSAGPILDPGARRALPFAQDIEAERGGTVRVTGGWRSARGAPVRTGARFRFQARGCGVRISWPARRGDRFELSTFFRKSLRRPGDQRVQARRGGSNRPLCTPRPGDLRAPLRLGLGRKAHPSAPALRGPSARRPHARDDLPALRHR